MTRAKILSASAGSGKTYQLAYKYVHDVISDPASYRNILAVTFTNKATEEMKTRILREINKLAAGEESGYMGALCRDLNLDGQTVRERAKAARTNILHDYSRFTVLTIDTFFQRILRAFIIELGIELDYTVELDPTTILEKSADALVEGIRDNRELQQWLVDFMHERMDESKRWDIREGILDLGSELFAEQNKEQIRNARSKEELRKIVNATTGRAMASQRHIVELANKAIGLIEGAGLSAGDFKKHTASFFYAAAATPTKEPTKTARNCSEPAESAWLAKERKSPAAQALLGELSAIMSEICRMYDRSVKTWNTAELLRENYRSFALLSDLYGKVVEMCEQENLMLLSETKYILSKFIADNDAPFIYEKVGTRFDRFMIDEFQDTSRKEWENFLPLLRNAMAQTTDTSVLIVGDVKQSIYRWRGGDWKILQETAPTALGNETAVVSLQDNYRSLPVIVEFNNDAIGKVVGCDNDMLNTQLDEACGNGKISSALRDELHDTLAKAYAGHRQNPKRGTSGTGYVDITLYDEEPPVIERIKSVLDKGFSPKDIMILTRSRSDGKKIAGVLLDFMHDNTDPRYKFDIMTQEALVISSSPVVRFVISVLSLAANPEDRVERSVFRGFSGSTSFEAPLSAEESYFLRSIRLLSPEEAFERTVMHFDLGREPRYTAYLQALHESVVRFCSGKTADIRSFLQWWEETGYKQSLNIEQSESTIEISTVHKAKGLEKKVIIIPYCNWALDPRSSTGEIKNFIWSQPHGDSDMEELGKFPVKTKRTMEDSYFAEGYFREKIQSHVDNINLLYVAFTRAAEALHIFIERPKKAEGSVGTVGRLLLAALGKEGFKPGADGCEHLEFGQFASPVKDDVKKGDTAHKETEHVTIDLYGVSEADMRLRLPSQRYFEDGASAELAPRNFGILMHKAFSQAVTVADIYDAVRQMTRDALISEPEAERLKAEIDKALSDPTVSSWFGEGWSEVRNENDIIVPKSSSTRRPDRVMTKGNKATVIDYKFGEEHSERYARQLREYMQLLHRIGYVEVDGYIWYVRLGRIEKVVPA